MHHHKYRLIIPFVLPGFLLYAVFVLWPYSQSFYVAMTDWGGFSPDKDFVGLANFRKLAGDDLFWNALKHNAQMLVVLPLGTISLALFFAALLSGGSRSVRGGSFYRIVFFFPQVMSAVILGILWGFIFHPSLGLLNGTLGAVGLESLQRPWLGDPDLVLWAIAAVVIWSAVGFYMVLFIAGMQSIPHDLYEAATLDGASRWSSFWGITLPLLRDHLQVALVFVGIGALDLFALVQVMAEGGGPSRAADVIARYMYDSAFKQSNFGYATAIGVVLLILTLALSLVTIKLTNQERVEF